jgi:hypothetical protein
VENPAVLADVEASFERPLTVDEKRVVPAWLGTAWRTLNREVRGVAARLDVAMVERKLRNPDGYRTWGGDTESSTIDSALSSGKIYVTDEERRSLAPADIGAGALNGMYSILLGRP